MPTFPDVEPQEPLEQLFDDVWRVHGSVQFKPLVRIGRNMVVLRDGDELTLVNSVRLNAAGESALEALGKVSHIVRIGIHGMDDAYYLDKYGARMWSLPDVEVVNGATATDTLGADEPTPFADLDLFVFQDTVKPEAALLLKRHGGLLITCDAIQHYEPSALNSVLANVVTGVMGFKHPAQIGPPWRKFMTPEGGTLRPDFERLAALPFKHLIGAHGGLLRDDGPAKLRATIERVYG
ncbi:MAG: hypothetical protein KC502_11780 [Myxococcales bacterium]|nr:hypothetical protein [Myxococcales bacterium]